MDIRRTYPPPRPPACGVCGRTLTGDPDDQADHPAGPLCGACVRAQEFDEMLWQLDGANDEDAW